MAFTYIPYPKPKFNIKVSKRSFARFFIILIFWIGVGLGLFYLISKKKFFDFVNTTLNEIKNFFTETIPDFFISILDKISEAFIKLVNKIEGSSKKTVRHVHFHTHGGFSKDSEHTHMHTHEFGNDSHGHKVNEVEFDEIRYYTQKPTTNEEAQEKIDKEKKDIKTIKEFKDFVNGDSYILIVSILQILIGIVFESPKFYIKSLLYIYIMIYFLANILFMMKIQNY